MSIYYNRKNPEPPTCPNHKNVVCDPNNRFCDRCGWNDEVARARLEKFCNQHGISIPAPRVPDETEEKEFDS